MVTTTRSSGDRQGLRPLPLEPKPDPRKAPPVIVFILRVSDPSTLFAVTQLSNPVMYVLAALNLTGALGVAWVMVWGARHAVPVLRPVYAATAVLCLAFAIAQIVLLADIDSTNTAEYISFLRLASWPLIAMPPIVGSRWVRRSSEVLAEMADKVDGR